MLSLLSTAVSFDPVLAGDPVTEAPHAKVYSNDLPFLGGEGIGAGDWNSSTNEVRVPGPGCGFEYQHPTNASIKATYTHHGYAESHWAGWLYILMRATDGNVSPTDGFTNRGYEIIWRGDGSTYFHKNGADLSAHVLTSAGNYQWGGSYETEFTTVDLSDGSVRVKFTVNGVSVVDYVDSDSPILEGDRYAAYTDQHTFSVLGDGLKISTPCISKVSSPVGSENFPWASYEDGKILTLASGAAGTGWSGVVFPCQTSGNNGYSVKVTPKQLAGSINLGIGWKNGPHDYNRPNITGEWGWETVGYLLEWERWGTLTLKRGQTSLVSVAGPAFVVDEEKSFSMAMCGFDGGSTRITVLLDGQIKLNYWDIPSAENAPIPCPKGGLGKTPGDLMTTAPIFSFWTAAEIDVTQEADLANKTIIQPQLGAPSFTGSQTIGPNGDVSSLGDGSLLWPTEIENTKVSFDLTPSGSDGSFGILLGYRGNTAALPDDDSWTRKGYEVEIRQNGSISLAKASSILAEGSPLSAFSLVAEGTYRVTASLADIGNAGLIEVAIDDVVILRYVDAESPLLGAFEFGLTCDGITGSATAANVNLPVVITPESLVVGVSKTLSYENPQAGDVVTYAIDATKSTATGTIEDDQVTATSEGNLYVYCVVNGIVGQSKRIVCEEPTIVLSGVPDHYVIGSGAEIKAIASLSDERALSSVTYEIAEGSQLATIDEEGNVTVTGIGQIRIQATIKDTNGFTFVSEAPLGVFVAKPMISLEDVSPMKTGQERVLSAEVNAEIPDGDGFAYQITAGSDCASLGGNTLTATKEGSCTIKVTFATGKPYETIELFEINVIAAKILSLPHGPIIVGDGTGFVKAGLSDGSDGTSVTYHVENGTGKAQIDEQTGEITYVAAGTVFVWAEVDGAITQKATLVLNPQVTLGNALAMVVGGERTLGYHANCELPNEDITLFYEVISGGDLVDLDTVTGECKALAIGVVSLRVHVIGETFSAVSPVISMSIENPIVVVTSPVRDMFVGQDQTIQATLGNGEIKEQAKSIQVIEGGDFVTVDGTNIHATAEGRVKIRVIINGVKGVTHEIVISQPSVMVVAGDMQLNDTQTLECLFLSQDFIPTSLVFELVNTDPSVATLEGNVLHSGNKTGDITIKVTVDGVLTQTTTIHVESAVSLHGVTDGAEYTVGAQVELSYFDAEDSGAKPEYHVVSGNAEIKIVDGKAFLQINGEGDIVLEVVVNGVSSRRITVKGAKPPEPPASSSDEGSSSDPISSSASEESSSGESSSVASSSETPQPQPSGGNNNVGMIVGIALGAVLGAAIATVTAVLIIKGRGHKNDVK